MAEGGEGAEQRLRVPLVDVKSIREGLGMTQQAFAARFGFSVGAVRHWEQGIRRPERAARLLLTLIRDEPEVVEAHLDRLTAEQR